MRIKSITKVKNVLINEKLKFINSNEQLQDKSTKKHQNKINQLVENNKCKKYTSTINKKYRLCLKYKTLDQTERHLLRYSLERLGTSKLVFDKKLVESLASCEYQVPNKDGFEKNDPQINETKYYGPFRNCKNQVLYPGFTRCYQHNTRFISIALERGKYKEIVQNGQFVCDPSHFVQVKWIEGKGFSLFIREGSKGDLVSWMDGPYVSRRDCHDNYV